MWKGPKKQRMKGMSTNGRMCTAARGRDERAVQVYGGVMSGRAHEAGGGIISLKSSVIGKYMTRLSLSAGCSRSRLLQNVRKNVSRAQGMQKSKRDIAASHDYWQKHQSRVDFSMLRPWGGDKWKPCSRAGSMWNVREAGSFISCSYGLVISQLNSESARRGSASRASVGDAAWTLYQEVIQTLTRKMADLHPFVYVHVRILGATCTIWLRNLTVSCTPQFSWAHNDCVTSDWTVLVAWLDVK